MQLAAILLVAGASVLLANERASAFQQNACVGVANPGLFFSPSPVRCDQYVRCFNGVTTIDHCPAGYNFDAPGQRCVTAANVDCTRCGALGVVNLPNPSNCQAFFECQFGTRTARVCGNGLLFDRRTGTCNVANQVTCGPGNPGGDGNPPLPVCPANVHVNLPHWNDCQRFFECFFGQRTERVCQGAFLFDTVSGQCVRAHLATCNGGNGGGNNPNIPPTCPATGQQNIPHSTNCSRFWECFFGTRTERQCPNGFLFDTLRLQCVQSHLATCKNGSGGGSGLPTQCPPTGTTAIPHPTDCTRFFRCSNGVSIAERCPTSAPHFNDRRLVCDSIANAQCNRR